MSIRALASKALRHRGAFSFLGCYTFLMKFLLTSAGLKNDKLVQALEALVGKSLSETSLLFIPTAANTSVDDQSWLFEDILEFQKHKFKNISIIDIAIPKVMWAPHFKNVDVVCFGGGNEKYLARIMEEQGFKEFILPLLDKRVYMGISAGSMVAGHFLLGGLTSEIFPEEDFGDENGNPMGILDLIFIPHMNSQWFENVRIDFLESIKEKFNKPTYATDDETALKIDGEKIEIVGGGASWVHKT